jgi:hypothetical protein
MNQSVFDRQENLRRSHRVPRKKSSLKEIGILGFVLFWFFFVLYFEKESQNILIVWVRVSCLGVVLLVSVCLLCFNINIYTQLETALKLSKIFLSFLGVIWILVGGYWGYKNPEYYQTSPLAYLSIAILNFCFLLSLVVVFILLCNLFAVEVLSKKRKD